MQVEAEGGEEEEAMNEAALTERPGHVQQKTKEAGKVATKPKAYAGSASRDADSEPEEMLET